MTAAFRREKHVIHLISNINTSFSIMSAVETIRHHGSRRKIDFSSRKPTAEKAKSALSVCTCNNFIMNNIYQYQSRYAIYMYNFYIFKIVVLTFINTENNNLFQLSQCYLASYCAYIY